MGDVNNFILNNFLVTLPFGNSCIAYSIQHAFSWKAFCSLDVKQVARTIVPAIVVVAFVNAI